MQENKDPRAKKNLPAPSLFSLMLRYKGIVLLLIALTVISNALSISVPGIISRAIDSYTGGNFVLENLIREFGIVAFLIFVFYYLQNIVQVYASERVARDMRNDIMEKISMQPYAFIESVTPAKLLTNLTSDVDAVKVFVSMAISTLISSVFLIVGVSVLLLLTDWKLALIVLSIVPFIGIAFFFIFKRVRKLFTRAQEAIDALNKVISESVLGSALIRLLDSRRYEDKKFIGASTEAKNISFEILKMFSTLIPIITFFTNLATLAIILFGGYFVVQGSMTLGNFTAFNSYLAILIFPIIMLGFMSNIIAQAQASYGRILKVLNAPVPAAKVGRKATLQGDIELRHVTVAYGEKKALKDVSFKVPAGSRTAIIGPTAAGKTQLLYLLTGLLESESGGVFFDGINISEYDKDSLHSQVGIVFQDSVMFNLSLRENIAFSNTVADRDIEKAIASAELWDFINTLPQKLDTVVSERGTNFSGGQKQRIMLARALALNPKVLLLDDFTARVDANTEGKILGNIAKNYPALTLISVTQKISSIERYDRIILLMEGELLAQGTHSQLLESSPEYAQIYQSQRSTNQYEVNSKK